VPLDPSNRRISLIVQYLEKRPSAGDAEGEKFEGAKAEGGKESGAKPAEEAGERTASASPSPASHDKKE
jgi:hypothetical protein